MNPIAELRGRCPARPEGAVAPAGGCRAGVARSRGQGAGGGERILPAGESGGERAGFKAVSWDRREQGLGSSGDVSEAQWGSVRPPPGATIC